MAVHFEPVSYADKRTVMVIAFREGERSPLPGHVPPKITSAEGKAQKAIMFKVLMRKARAFAALALQCFENDGVWLEDNRMDARGYFEDAKDGEQSPAPSTSLVAEPVLTSLFSNPQQLTWLHLAWIQRALLHNKSSWHSWTSTTLS